MKRLIAVFLLILAVAGCTSRAQVVPSAKKEALRKILTAEFAFTSVPKEKEEEFFLILEAFDAGRPKNEFVRSIEFKSGSEAVLSFADGGIHGGGVAIAKKKSDQWVIDEKYYLM